jgi:hypothetical protein
VWWVAQRRFFSQRLGITLVAFQIPVLAQFISPSGGDPVAVACPNGLTADSGIDALNTWQKGKHFASIEGDGVAGFGNWSHVPESLAWYCKAWAAGNPVAAYDIAEIFREGYPCHATPESAGSAGTSDRIDAHNQTW